MKQIFLYISIFFITVTITAQNSNRIFNKAEFFGNDNTLKVYVNDGLYKIKFYTTELIETTFIPNGEIENTSSHTVVLQSQNPKIEFSENENDINFSSEGFEVTINKNPFQISYTLDGKSIISEKRGFYKSKHKAMDIVKDNISVETTEKIEFNLSKDEVLYGGGARALGMNRRGHRLALFNKAHYGYETYSELMNFTMPTILSSNKYLIHFDNAPIGYLDLDSNQDNTLTYETISGRKTYQIVVGESWEDILNNYTDLTGKQPMPPRWALGNFSSRFGYHSQAETEATINKFKEEKIPVDAIILDLYWFGKDIQGTMGNLEVYRDSFPDFEGMVKRLKNKGVKTITITEPFILSTSTKWQEAVNKDVLAKDSVGNPARYDFYFGNTGIIDIYKPEGKHWFWNIYKDIVNTGVAGVWGDLGEPEVHPNWVQHHTGSASEVHNIYGHDWAKLVYEGYAKDFPETRPFILMRAGYSGSQRYGLIPWSGDVNRTWGGLQSQPEIALQMGMQGLAYMHSDLGGFAGNNLDDELYIRWLQYGVFQPIYRPHAQESVPSEPVFRSDKAKKIAKKAIKLRYQLLPYNYNLVFENNQKGTPLMRPLFFEDDTKNIQTNASTYFWGDDFLITPVLTTKLSEIEVYFPENSNWFSFYTDEKVEGGQTKTITVTEDKIPTFVRGGAFIPMANLVQNTSDYKANNLNIHYYFDEAVEETEYKMYNDDGVTKNAFEKGKYEILKFKAELEKRCLEIEFEAKTGEQFSTSNKNITLIIHNIQKQPKSTKIGRKKVTVNWNSTNKTVSIPFVWDTKEKFEVKIKFKK